MLRSLAPRPILSATRPARPAGPVGPAPIRVAPMHAAPVSSSSRRSVATAAAQGASTVRVSVQGRHLEVTPSLKAYAEEKVSHAMQNFESAVKSADVKLSVAGGDAGKGAKAQKTEVTIYTLRHGVVRVEDVESTAYASIDVVCDKVRGKMRRLKEKAMQKGKWPGSARPRGAVPLADELAAEAAAVASSSDDDEDWAAVAAAAAKADAGGGAAGAPAPELLREKTFVLTRMSAGDAAEAAELLGHSFYVYEDAEAGGVRVVYKREARGYGVIIPTIAK